MAFWSSEKLKQTAAQKPLIIEGFDPHAVKQGAYELRLGPETFLTSYEDNRKKTLAEGEQLVIPPGQFGLLLTEEKISLPNSAIGFISIKAGIKFRGLVNVSGFHVDPGFSGRLKFSVYNAGSRDIVLERKQRVFLLWFSDLDQPTEPYEGEHANQNEITPDDVMKIQGQIASPGQLKKDIRELEIKFEKETQRIEGKLDNLKVVLAVFVTLAASFLSRGCFQSADKPQKNPPAAQTTNLGVTQPTASAK